MRNEGAERSFEADRLLLKFLSNRASNVCLSVCVRVQICCTRISVSLKDWRDSESGALVNICSEERVDVRGGGGQGGYLMERWWW